MNIALDRRLVVVIPRAWRPEWRAMRPAWTRKPKRQTVRVQIVDADGLSAEDSAGIDIYAVTIDDEAVSPVCRIKPWLPMCQEDDG